MMQKLKEEITAAANRELNRANEQFPLFTSKHEGVAVAYEELEESKEALEELEASFKCLWDDVRGKETPCYLKEEITPLKIADYAINLPFVIRTRSGPDITATISANVICCTYLVASTMALYKSGVLSPASNRSFNGVSNG